MTQQKHHFEISEAIDSHLLRDGFEDIALVSGQTYQRWYAEVLSSMALLASGDKVTYAYSSYEPNAPKVFLVVFTTSLVLVANIDTNADVVPAVQIASRHSLVHMQMSVSERIDSRDRRSHEWPGMINLVLGFRGIRDQIEIVGNGVDFFAIDRPTPIINLIESLRSDLAR